MAVAGPSPKKIEEYEKEWDATPLFMRSMPPGDQEDNVALQALQSLVYEDGPEETANALKMQANDYFKAQKYREALSFYTQALDEVGKDLAIDTRRTLLANRAACHLELHNFGSCLRDCATVFHLGRETTIDVDAETLQRQHQTTCKALYRSARALVALDRLDEADDALRRLRTAGEPDAKLERRVVDRRAVLTGEQDARDAARHQRADADEHLRAALHARGLVLPRGWTLAAASSACPDGVLPPHFDDDTNAEVQAICFPVFVLRPLASPPTRDLILEWVEDVPVSMHFDALDLDATHEAYVATVKGRLLKVGRHVSLKAIIAAAAKADEPDGLLLRDGWCLDVFAVPQERSTPWTEEMKASLKA